MDCPQDIAEVVLELLSHGFTRVRAFASAQEPTKCFIESDHLHNLPMLLRDYRPERLAYYWEIERPSFIAQVPERERRDLEPYWKRLEALIQKHDILLHHEKVAVGAK
ncbi:MAG: hypothetical protein SFU86_25585 [Pirellulaceae bacterium]|nr:hypothetical protein [Pirellulaceae bacterium]